MKENKFLKLTFSRIVTVSCFLLFAMGEARGVTYYVSPGGNDNYSGASSAPFKTIQKAADIVNPGDTVIVKDGIYTDANSDGRIVTFSKGGISGGWVTFKAENTWGAVLDCQNNTTDYGFDVNAGYIRIEEFEVKGCARGGIWSNASKSHVYIYGNHIHDIGRWTGNEPYGRAGIFVGFGTGYHTIDSNVIHTIGRLNPNTTPPATQASCTYGIDVRCYQLDHGIYAYGHNNTIINNVFYDDDSGWLIQVAGGTAAGDGPNWNIVNNTFYGMNPRKDGHIVIWTAPGGTTATNVLIQNNISYGARNAFVHSLSGASSTWQFKNNLVYGARKLITGSYKSLIQPKESGNIIGQDPGFVDTSTYNFHLQSHSPAIDKGLAADAPSYDQDKRHRSQGSAIDIGAYEYVGEKKVSDSPRSRRMPMFLR